MAKTVSWDYVPRDWQVAAHEMPHRFRVLVIHRRAGKTVLAIMDLLGQALQNAGTADRPTMYAYVAPLRSQAKATAWDMLKARAGKIPGTRINEAELRVDLPNHARIMVAGADNPDSLRGLGFNGVVMDEVADMRPSVWPLVIRPALADRKGWALFIGTPRGRDAFHDLYRYAANDNDADWGAMLLRASDTNVIDAAELLALRRSQTEDQYAQEFECSFAAAIKGAYYAKLIEDARQCVPPRVTAVPHDPSLPVHTAWDLGWSDATAVWFAQVAGREVRLIDYQEWTETPLDRIAQDILSRRWTWGRHILPHDAAVHELGTGTSRRATIEGLLQARCEVLPAANVQDGINAVQMVLPRTWIDATRCADGLHALERYTVEAMRAGERHVYSHGADALRYLVSGLNLLQPAQAMQPWKPRKRVA